MLLALTLAPGPAIGAGPDGRGTGARFEWPAGALGAGSLERQQLAQGPAAPRADPEDAEGVPPLTWLRYSSERFRTLMRMLAARSDRYQAKRAAQAREDARRAAEAKAAKAERDAELKAVEEAKRAAAAKAAEEARGVAEAKAAEEARRAEEAKRVAEAKAVEARREAEAKVAEEAKRIAAAKAAEEAKRVAEEKAAEEARRVEEAKRIEAAKAAEDAKRVAEEKAAEEARRAEEVRRAEEAKRVADTRKALEITQTVEAGKKTAADKPAKAAPMAERKAARPARCRNAGVKVRGGGWYVVKRGDTLWGIARAHYGYGRTYRRIHAANRRIIADPARIYPCQRIYIPRAHSGFGGAPAPELQIALAPFIRRRPIGTELPGFTG